MRTFGMIASSVWRSRRFRALKTDTARLAYFYLHTTTHGNSAGVFVMPPEMAAIEMRIPAEDIREAFLELHNARLIRYDAAEELVQIVNFFRFNVITSRKHLAGPLRMVRSMPQSPVRSAAAADLVAAIYDRARSWDKSVDARGPFLQEASNLVREFDLAEVLCSPDLALPIELLIGLSDDLLIALPIQGNGKGNGNNTETDTDTRRRQDGDKTEIREDQDRAQPEPRFEGSRSARSVPEDIQRTIADLGKKKGM